VGRPISGCVPHARRTGYGGSDSLSGLKRTASKAGSNMSEGSVRWRKGDRKCGQFTVWLKTVLLIEEINMHAYKVTYKIYPDEEESMLFYASNNVSAKAQAKKWLGNVEIISVDVFYAHA